MENKEYNTVEDFVFNKSFQEWVLKNDPYSTKFWLNWISYNPDKASLINHSRAIVDSLPAHKRKASEEEINDLIERIISNTKGQPVVLPGDLITPRPRKRVLTISRKNWLKIVAIFVLVVACTWYLVTSHSSYPNAYKSFASGHTNSLEETMNNSSTVQEITLKDGSRVWLESKSRLSYANEQLPGKREVFLTGRAKFSIKTDLARPFFVYTQSTISKATGTDFDISQFPDKKTTITVSRGNVQVFKRRDVYEGGTRLYKLMGTVVTANQELVFNEANNIAYKTLVANPVAVGSKAAVPGFTNQSAITILTALQQQYAIPILFNVEALSSCRLSINIGNQPFYDALNALCKQLNASYEVLDGTVLINAAGCK